MSRSAITAARRARQITGVLEDPQEEKQDQDLGEEHHHRADARPDAIHDQRLNPALR
jgi:hypothetical protein